MECESLERAALLAPADPELHREVESLLEAMRLEGMQLYRKPPAEDDHSRVTGRCRWRDFVHMEIEMTFDDPKTYTRPFAIKVPFGFFGRPGSFRNILGRAA